MKRKFAGISAIVSILLLLFAVYLYNTFKSVIVQGDSMEPNLRDGQRVLVGKAYWLLGSLERDDVVVIQDDNEDGYIIKRIFRMAGDTVPTDKWPEGQHSIANGPYTVPEGTVFVLGDNQLNSEDSRHFGPVESSRIIGKVVGT